MPLITQCVCGGVNFTEGEHNHIPIAVCSQCGVIHQRLLLTPKQYREYYEQEYHTSVRQYRRNIRFPAEYFTFITLHDVLEHLVNPLLYLKEIHRILIDQGTVIIDFPNFFVEEGQHHWKRVEHLWYFTIQQLNDLVTSNGFEIVEETSPILSKILLVLKKASAHVENGKPQFLQ